MSGGWGCPYNDTGVCRHVAGRKCDPGMKGCVLAGRYVFSREEKNLSRRQKQKASPGNEPDKK